MPTEDAICVTKESVKAMIGILNQTIDVLRTKGSKVILTDEEYSMIDDAKRELEVYKDVSKMMDKKRHITLCLMTSAIKKKGRIKVYTERDEGEDIVKFSEETDDDWIEEENKRWERYKAIKKK